MPENVEKLTLNYHLILIWEKEEIQSKILDISLHRNEEENAIKRLWISDQRLVVIILSREMVRL